MCFIIVNIFVFSKFLRPGSVRVGMSLPSVSSSIKIGEKSLDGVAFVTPSQQRVLILHNFHQSATEKLLIEDPAMGNRILQLELEPHSIATVVWNKLR